MGETWIGTCAVPNGASAVRRVHFHDGTAPVAAVVYLHTRAGCADRRATLARTSHGVRQTR